MSLIKIKIKDIKDFLKVNSSIQMPMISKAKNGDFLASGEYVDVHSYKEYQDQVKLYQEFIEYLEYKYNAEVPKMFKAALTKVLILKNEGLTSKRLHSKEVTKSQYESFTEEDYLRTLNFISKAALEKRLLKPARAIKDITTKKDGSMRHTLGTKYVLPLISENGVMVKRRGDVRGQFQASTVTLSYTEAQEVKQAMLDEAEQAGAGEEVKKLIEDIFELAASIGEKDKANTINNLSMELRKTLVAKCTELFGVDLARYENANRQAEDGDTQNKEDDIIEFDVNEIEMIMKNGKLIIKRIQKEDEKENG